MIRPSAALAFAALAVSLAACGGRAANPVAMKQSFDADLSCTQIVAEVEANQRRIQTLKKEDDDRAGHNAAVATIGVILVGLPALAMIDDGEAQQKEGAAFRVRNKHLAQMAAEKECPEAAQLAAATGYSGSPREAATDDPAVAQAAFEAWYAGNRAAFDRKLNDAVSGGGGSCAIIQTPAQVTVQDADAYARNERGYAVNVRYGKLAQTSSCSEEGAFLVEVAYDELVDIERLGPPNTALPAPTPVVAAKPATTAAPTTAQAMTTTAAASATEPAAAQQASAPAGAAKPIDDLAAAQAEWDTWYAGNRQLFNETFLEHLRKTDKHEIGRMAAGDVRVYKTEVTSVGSDGTVLRIEYELTSPSYWGYSSAHKESYIVETDASGQLVSIRAF